LGAGGSKAVATQSFPKNPADLLPDVPHVVKANGNRVIQPSENLRIRAEQHPLHAGETFNPRHHGQHYHVERRIDPNKSWNNGKNVEKLKPEGYTPGEGTGFLPGEPFPGK
jgi:filamentous hemagglutinin